MAKSLGFSKGDEREITKLDFAIRLKTGFSVGNESGVSTALLNGGLDIDCQDADYLVLDDHRLIKCDYLKRRDSLFLADQKEIETWSLNSSTDYLRDGKMFVFHSAPSLTRAQSVDLRSEDELISELNIIADGISHASSDYSIKIRRLIKDASTWGLSKREEASAKAGLARLQERVERAGNLMEFALSSAHVEAAVADYVSVEKAKRLKVVSDEIDREVKETRENLGELRELVEQARSDLRQVNEQRALSEEIERKAASKVAEQDAELMRRLDDVGSTLDRRFEEHAVNLDKRLSDALVAVTPLEPAPKTALPTNVEDAVEMFQADRVRRSKDADTLSSSVVDGLGGIAYAIACSIRGLNPVFTGPNASEVAACMTGLINPAMNFVRTADPTMISLSDVFADRAALDEMEFRTFLKVARRHVDVFFPVAICDINNSPSRFWLRALDAERMRGVVPKNVLFFLSVTDEKRTEALSASCRSTTAPIATASIRPTFASNSDNIVWGATLDDVAKEKVIALIEELGTASALDPVAAEVMHTSLSLIEAPTELLTSVCSTHLRWLHDKPSDDDRFPAIVKDD